MKPHPLVEEVLPVFSKPALRLPPTEMTTLEKIDAYVVLDRLEKAIKARKDALKEDLKAYADQTGEVSEKGHKISTVDGTKLINECRKASVPDETALRALCLKKKLPKKLQPFTTVKRVVFDPSKLEMLVQLGHLKEEDLGSLYAITYALLYEASEELKSLIGEASKSTPVVLTEQDYKPTKKVKTG